jgi:hypothetical protein
MPEMVWAREEVAFMLVEATVLNSKIRAIILAIIFMTVQRLRDFEKRKYSLGSSIGTRDDDRLFVSVFTTLIFYFTVS